MKLIIINKRKNYSIYFKYQDLLNAAGSAPGLLQEEAPGALMPCENAAVS